MTMKVVFDPLKTMGTRLEGAVKAVDGTVTVTFHNTRDEKPKPPVDPDGPGMPDEPGPAAR